MAPLFLQFNFPYFLGRFQTYHTVIAEDSFKIPLKHFMNLIDEIVEVNR